MQAAPGNGGRSRFGWASSGHDRPMTDHENTGLDPEELEATNGEQLPEREAMSIIATPGDDLLTLPVEPRDEDV